jgi:hypothetical protein
MGYARYALYAAMHPQASPLVQAAAGIGQVTRARELLYRRATAADYIESRPPGMIRLPFEARQEGQWLFFYRGPEAFSTGYSYSRLAVTRRGDDSVPGLFDWSRINRRFFCGKF